MRHILHGLAVLGLFGIGESSDGAIIEYTFSGEITLIAATNSNNAADDAAFAQILPFAVGSEFTGNFTFDSDAPDELSRTDLGLYRPATYLWDFGDDVIFREDPGSGQVSVGNQNEDVFAVTGGIGLLPDGWSREWTGGTSHQNMVSFVDTDGLNLMSDVLPTLLTLDGWESVEIVSRVSGSNLTYTTTLGSHTGTSHEFRGTLTSLQKVPEPSSIAFFSMAFLAFAARGLRRHVIRTISC